MFRSKLVSFFLLLVSGFLASLPNIFLSDLGLAMIIAVGLSWSKTKDSELDGNFVLNLIIFTGAWLWFTKMDYFQGAGGVYSFFFSAVILAAINGAIASIVSQWLTKADKELRRMLRLWSKKARTK
ncbi:MAG: hypothetical protein WCJ33_02505 [Pseudomonadota bacterium]